MMIRGKSFYAIWDEERSLWSTDEYDVCRLVDKELDEYRKKCAEEHPGVPISVRHMSDFSTKSWQNYRKYLRDMYDDAHQLDENLTFSNSLVKKTDYASKRLSYPLEKGRCDAYEELIGTLYNPEERQKLEWAVGAIVAGDAKHIQKFIVLYGESGSGKSTFLNIIQKLFDGYYTAFESKALTNSNNSFSTEPFKDNPLVGIEHDGDLSRIEDNSKLNSLVSHEKMSLNAKYQALYTARILAFLFVGTNKPVRMTDAKSGLIRRLIDVTPSGNKVDIDRYHTLIDLIDFELGAIAYHCLEVYKSMGKNYYSNYKPLEMMFQTDTFFNFVEENYYIFKRQDGISLSQAYEMYKTYCDESLITYKLAKHKFREEMKSYFETFKDRSWVEGKQVRNYYSGFLSNKFVQTSVSTKEEYAPLLELTCETSYLDEILASCPAQYANTNETPDKKWDDVTSVLSDLDTSRLHYLLPPTNHIVIDFDLKDETGQKSKELNLEAASKWPPTYSEFSKSGSGVHLHYIYNGDTNQLRRLYSEGIEVLIFSGKSSLRRKLSLCNDLAIATISSNLPLKGEKMVNFESVANEQAIRTLITKNLNKEYHPSTASSVSFIKKILDDAYESGITYDVVDLRPKVLAFANNSTNQADVCIKLVMQMKWASEDASQSTGEYTDEELVFFDVEVFPNLFLVCWKVESKNPVIMINPSPSEMEELFRFKLVGFNNRRYDNHIMYARYIGYNNQELYELSQKIVSGSRNAMFGEAYNISYTDAYDFSSKKQSLKKFQIELGIHHQELGYKWDEPVPEHLWSKVGEYCINDVVSLQAVFESRKQDYIARLILADLSGLTPNDTTQMHTAKIIFGDDKRPQDKFNYTDLSEMFPGYVFDGGKSFYRDEVTGEGGYVYSEPGMYSNVAVLDVASMHPTSLVEMDMFGPYTKNFKELLDARIAIKHKDYDRAKAMLGGILSKYLTSAEDSVALSYALKIVINIVYGLTSAKFDNKFRDPRNKDNIVAKRGALFMIDLKHAVQEKGYQVVHIKTDSIKIPNATQEIIDFVMEFGQKYGYTFEHEDTYSRFCLVNDAVYIARTSDTNTPIYDKNDNYIGPWTATGTQFAQSYVFKSLFSHEPITFEDLFETKTVTSALYLDMNENLGEDEHDYRFVGKAGAFCPIISGRGGGVLLREKDGKYNAATGSKGYRWLEAEMVKALNREEDVDHNYYLNLVDDAVDAISKFGDFEWFISDTLDVVDDSPPWTTPCGKAVPCAQCVANGGCSEQCSDNNVANAA